MSGRKPASAAAIAAAASAGITPALASAAASAVSKASIAASSASGPISAAISASPTRPASQGWSKAVTIRCRGTPSRPRPAAGCRSGRPACRRAARGRRSASARRSACSIRFSTGSLAFASASSAKYIRVLSPMLMPRATIQRLRCGAIGRPLRPGHDAGLHRVEAPEPGVEVRDHPAPAAEARLDLARAPVRRVGVDAGGVGLPDLDQHVLHRRAGAVEHQPLDPDPLARGVRPGDVGAELLLEDLEPGRAGRQADVDVGPGGLRSRSRGGSSAPAAWLSSPPGGSRTASSGCRAARCRTCRRGCRAGSTR